MERRMETHHVDGHTVDVVEVVEDDERYYLLLVDEVCINADEPLGSHPGADDTAAFVRRWAARSTGA